MKDQKRTIDGIKYISRKKVYTSKLKAQKYAEWQRKTGSNARVIEISPGKWRVFIAEISISRKNPRETGAGGYYW